MSDVHIHGYANRFSFKAGEDVQFMISAEGAETADAQLVRLIHGDEHPRGPGMVEAEINSPANGVIAVHKQYVQSGNYLSVTDPDRRLAFDRAFTLHAFIFPTLLSAGSQTILGRGSIAARAGYALAIDHAARLGLWIGDGSRVETVTLPKPLLPQIWYFVAATFDPATGAVTLRQRAVVNRYNSLWSKIVPCDYDAATTSAVAVRPLRNADFGFLIGGTNDHAEARGAFVSHLYNGKIDRCGAQGRVLDEAQLDALQEGAAPFPEEPAAYWNPSQGYTDQGIGDKVVDVGPFGLDAMGHNRPVRGQTGWNWNGRSDSFRLAPHEYGGVEFHSDALTDCRWAPSLKLTLPADLKSGAYALRLTARNGERLAVERIVFFVRPVKPRGPICFLAPTASYLAYANGPRSLEADVAQVIMARTPILTTFDMEACDNNYEFGLSTYDLHRDGAGVCYTSCRRPMYTMQPTYRLPGVAAPWQFPADLSVIAWLDHQGYDYDVITDEDLDREGLAALAPYRVVINGTHCEYYSERMMDATEDYLAQGGRLLYLSGNGYYWVVAFRPDEPWVMEVRKLELGSRAWQARPGESYLATTGERGGLWRHRNRAPQKLVGVGFSSEGMDVSVCYRRMPDSHDPGAQWIFEGVEGETIGDFGLVHGGAVGLEIDRYDLTLGTPPNTFLIAASEPLTSNWPLVQEEVLYTHAGLGGDQHPMVRCDMVYFTTCNGGAVFSPSSIAWGSALPWNGFDNNVSKVMKNVVDAFLRDSPPRADLPGPLARAAV